MAAHQSMSAWLALPASTHSQPLPWGGRRKSLPAQLPSDWLCAEAGRTSRAPVWMGTPLPPKKPGSTLSPVSGPGGSREGRGWLATVGHWPPYEAQSTHPSVQLNVLTAPCYQSFHYKVLISCICVLSPRNQQINRNQSQSSRYRKIQRNPFVKNLER